MEEYRIIEGFENYSASDLGNVKNNKTERIMKPHLERCGYYRIVLRNDKKDYKLFVHPLVALAFIKNTENKKIVDHINNDKLNNNLTNLRWATNTENLQNATAYAKNTSGTKGVHFKKQSNKWQSRINIDGIKIHLGYFVDKQDAINARVQKANKVFGIYTNKCEKIINV
jgi:hypothetical protein